jgi:hypothetical protein
VTRRATVPAGRQGAEREAADGDRYEGTAVERQRERERLREAVVWWESAYGRITEEELAEAEAERREIERRHAERERRAESSGVRATAAGGGP